MDQTLTVYTVNGTRYHFDLDEGTTVWKLKLLLSRTWGICTCMRIIHNRRVLENAEVILPSMKVAQIVLLVKHDDSCRRT